MPTTTRGYTYPGVNDAPNGPSQIQTLASDIDSDVQGIEDRLDGTDPTQVTDSTNLSGIVSTSWAAGSPACGTAFTAPDSGKVKITVSGSITQGTNGNEMRLGFEVRTGSTVGSGTSTLAADRFRAYVIGRAVNTGGAAYGSASYGPYLLTGLTPGDPYNVRTMHQVSGGTGGLEYRSVLVEPVL